jgi:HEPN domain-containing protein
MDEDKKLAVQAWLFKAQRDLASAQRLADKNAPLLDTAIYHCQQAAEKAVKGFLVYHDRRFQKTHDLALLILEASHFTQDFVPMVNAADRLTRYATLFRYPGVLLEPILTEYDQAYRDAAEFVRVTLALIPAEAHPAS